MNIKRPEDQITMNNIMKMSNFISVLMSKGRVEYNDLWFTCLSCKKERTSEQMYFFQKQENDIVIQNFSTFFGDSIDLSTLGGLDDNFDFSRPVGMLCKSCLENVGVSTDDIEVINIPSKEEYLV